MTIGADNIQGSRKTARPDDLHSVPNRSPSGGSGSSFQHENGDDYDYDGDPKDNKTARRIVNLECVQDKSTRRMTFRRPRRA